MFFMPCCFLLSAYPPPADKTDTLSPSPNQNTSFNIEPPNDEDKPGNNRPINSLVTYPIICLKQR